MAEKPSASSRSAPTCRGCGWRARRWPRPTPGSIPASRASPRASAPCATGTRTRSPWAWRRRATASRARTAARWPRCCSPRPRCPFEDRLNAGILVEALNLKPSVDGAGPHRLAARRHLGADHGAADGARRRRAGAGRRRREAPHQDREPAGAADRRRRGRHAGRHRAGGGEAHRLAPAARSTSSTTSAARAPSSTTPGRSAGSATRATRRSCPRRSPTCSRRPT